jgi:predicted glycoside hydrolase/deacetylase ChbG (UPF0249 family)
VLQNLRKGDFMNLFGFLGLTAILASQTQPLMFSKLIGDGNTKYLIVHADDLGMCHAENEASFKAMEAGLVTSGSVMMPCPWVMEVVEYAKSHPNIDIGIHLTLNSEWKTYRWRPVLPPEKVPGLVDPEGYLWRSVEDTLKHASAAEVEAECRAQIQRALSLGLKPTHLDTHMGTVVAKPEFLDVYLKLGKEFGLPVMLPLNMLESGNYVTPPQVKQLLPKVIEAGVPLLDALAGGVKSADPEERRKEYISLLRALRPGVTQIILHLGTNSDELKAITSSANARYGDFLAFTHPETKQHIKELGIKLIGWRELAEALKTK